jgi:hypothetical protein
VKITSSHGTNEVASALIVLVSEISALLTVQSLVHVPHNTPQLSLPAFSPVQTHAAISIQVLLGVQTHAWVLHDSLLSAGADQAQKLSATTVPSSRLHT